MARTPSPTRETRTLPRQDLLHARDFSENFAVHEISIANSLALASSVVAQRPASAVSSEGKHPLTFEDMTKLKRVGAPVPLPDGLWVVFDCEDVEGDASPCFVQRV